MAYGFLGAGPSVTLFLEIGYEAKRETYEKLHIIKGIKYVVIITSGSLPKLVMGTVRLMIKADGN